jgi:3-oxoacyl-[acyl-carrier-protein] synthase III
MGTIIKSVAAIKPLFRKKILTMTVQSVKQCLKNSGIDVEHIGMLVNTSIYSENHLGEPALASLIQKKIQFYPFRKKLLKNCSDKMFSFDLHSGGGGIIAAIQLLDGFLQTGEIQNGLVVAGDVKPTSGSVANFKYLPGAATIMLSSEPGNKGFESFRTYTFPDFISDLESSINWDSGKFKFSVQQKKVFLNNCVSCAMTSIHQFFEEKQLAWEQVDLVMTSHCPTGFNGLLKKETGIKNKMVEISGNKNFYSAGLLFSLNKVFYTRQFSTAKNILFVTVGAGITVSLSLYKN